jgi:hypothetical protein
VPPCYCPFNNLGSGNGALRMCGFGPFLGTSPHRVPVYQRRNSACQGMQSATESCFEVRLRAERAAKESTILLLRSHSSIQRESPLSALIRWNCSSQISLSGNCFVPDRGCFSAHKKTVHYVSIPGDWVRLPQRGFIFVSAVDRLRISNPKLESAPLLCFASPAELWSLHNQL